MLGFRAGGAETEPLLLRLLPPRRALCGGRTFRKRSAVPRRDPCGLQLMPALVTLGATLRPLRRVQGEQELLVGADLHAQTEARGGGGRDQSFYSDSELGDPQCNRAVSRCGPPRIQHEDLKVLVPHTVWFGWVNRLKQVGGRDIS